MKIKKPRFWDNKRKNFLALLLYPLTLFLFIVNLIKINRAKPRKKIKTICVGNIYLGGTGKTPLSIKLYNHFKSSFKTAIIKKKYSDQIDEQKLISLQGKLFCEKSRLNALEKAENEDFELAIFDDGLQDKKIKYDLSIVCFNSILGYGNGLLIPAGPLRENLFALKKYNIAFINGVETNQKLVDEIKNNKIKIFEGYYEFESLNDYDLNKGYLLFCGIGNPDSFLDLVKKNNFNVENKLFYPDHYQYSDDDIRKIKKIAKEKNLNIITTEKDYLRLDALNKEGINFIKIKLVIKNENEFFSYIKKSL